MHFRREFEQDKEKIPILKLIFANAEANSQNHTRRKMHGKLVTFFRGKKEESSIQNYVKLTSCSRGKEGLE